MAELESHFLADVLHVMVLWQDEAEDAGEFFLSPNFDKATEQFRSKPLLLPSIVDDDGEFSFVKIAHPI